MHNALKMGGKSFFKRYLPFFAASWEKLTFKQLFSCENGVEVARERRDRVAFTDFRDEEYAARSDLFSVRGERLPQKPFDFVSFNAFSILLSHADGKPCFLCRKIHERYRLRKRPLSASKYLFDFLVFFQTETAFRHLFYAETCFLPLFLRRLMTFLPPVVFMRLRKPCTLLRCLFLGW